MAVAVAVAVIGLGYLGPHTSPRATPTPTASPATDRALHGPVQSTSPAPTSRLGSGIDALAGLTRLDPTPEQISATWLPLQISSRSLANIGTRLFYIVGADRIESSVLGSGADPQTLVSVPGCEAINQLAAAGHEVAYVVTSPAGRSAQINLCGPASVVGWSIWLLDLDGGKPRQVAQGTRPLGSLEVDEFPVHLALTDSAYAFDRPSPVAADAGESVEVHSLDGAVLWKSEASAPVKSVMLGGDRLAFLTDGVPLSAGPLDLWTSTATRPLPWRVGKPATSASLSADGSYLTWDVDPASVVPTPAGRTAVAIEAVDSGQLDLLIAETDLTQPQPLQPAVAATDRGPVVAWFATAPNGTVYPAFRYASSAAGSVLSSAQQPIWIGIDHGTLIWVALGPDGWSSAAFAVNLDAIVAFDRGHFPAGEIPAEAPGTPAPAGPDKGS